MDKVYMVCITGDSWVEYAFARILAIITTPIDLILRLFGIAINVEW
jgi:hypothetical protein